MKPDKDKLDNLYWGKEKTLEEIANKFDVSVTQVFSWMDDYNIDRRSPGRSPGSSRPHISKEELLDLYHNKGNTLKEVGEEFGVSPNYIRKIMIEYGIPRRDPGEDLRFDIDKDILEKLYNEERKSVREIGEMYDVSRQTISNRLADYDIETGYNANHHGTLSKV